ncbi:hypothetical protein M1116_00295 [Patescibacteria group bacterium]|nr:hypothetical protein [Patescibacteria group bacterium]
MTELLKDSYIFNFPYQLGVKMRIEGKTYVAIGSRKQPETSMYRGLYLLEALEVRPGGEKKRVTLDPIGEQLRGDYLGIASQGEFIQLRLKVYQKRQQRERRRQHEMDSSH